MVLHGRFPYLSFPRRYRKSDYAAVRRAMEKADALELADRPMQELSGGQRQKVYLAMALAQETPAVFMDEPTTFLDVRHQMDVMRTARGLADGGKAVVLVSHDLCQALRTADRVALLADGRLCMAGTPEQVYAGGALDGCSACGCGACPWTAAGSIFANEPDRRGPDGRYLRLNLS